MCFFQDCVQNGRQNPQEHLSPWNKFMHVQFWVSSSSSSPPPKCIVSSGALNSTHSLLLLFSVNLLSVVWIVTVFNLARSTSSSAGESIASAAASSGFASPNSCSGWLSRVRQTQHSCLSWLESNHQLITFLYPSPFSWVHFIGHPHAHHDLKVHSLAMKACCRRCGGRLSGVTNALAVATF